jgi:Uma2 family endonuclease
MGQTDSNPSDEFYYGFRQVIQQDVTGQPTYVRHPLQLADFLDPRPDDQFVQGIHHERDLDEIVRILRYHHRNNQYVTVARSHKLRWDDPALPAPIADVALFVSPPGVESTSETPARPPRCIIEVTSPRLAEVDLAQKPDVYARAGVAEYIIIDSGHREECEEDAYRVLGFRLQDGGYTALEPDAQGRIHSATNQLWIGPTPQRDGFVVVDERTGQPIRPDPTPDQDRSAQASGERRASELSSALEFLRKGGNHA